MDTELEINRDNLLSWLGFFLYPGTKLFMNGKQRIAYPQI